MFCLCFRLLGVWQLVYNIAQQYAEELKRFKGCDGWEEEDQMLSVIVSQIQTALQATGQNLEEGSSLLSHAGLQQKTVTIGYLCRCIKNIEDVICALYLNWYFNRSGQ